MENRHITETDDEFRVQGKFSEIQFVDYTNAAIAATHHPNGINILTVKIFLNDSSTKIIITGKNEI